jgi:hypothetical protein
MILFLDSDPNKAAIIYRRMTEQQRSNTIWCSTVKETILTLKDYKHRLKIISLEHDLNDELYMNTKREDCGMEVIRFFERLSKDEKEFQSYKEIKFIIHTWNSHAGPRMEERLKKIGLNVILKPFGT